MENCGHPSVRTQTDASLRLERQRTDDELCKTINLLEQAADGALKHERKVADRALQVSRRQQEARGERGDGSLQARPGSRGEQSCQGNARQIERQTVDIQRAKDRATRHTAIAGRLKNERCQTDEHLALERARSDDGLMEILGQLAEATRCRDEFLALAAHELKTPLTPMALRLQSLEREAAGFPESPFAQHVSTYAHEANARLQKLTALIADLLDVSHLTAGRITIENQQVDFGAIVRSVVRRFQEQRASEHHVIDVDAPSAMGQWDELRLEQLVTNLLDNAIKFGCRKAVCISLRSFADKAQLTVEDHGIGIAPENHARIFRRFERAVSPRNYSGLGLGLYVCHIICEAMGGTITVRSAPNSGSIFTVELPTSPSLAP